MSFKTVPAIAALFASTIAFAATTAAIPEGVTVSTDPAKAAEVERHAQEIQAHQHPSMNSSGTGSAKPIKHHRKHAKKHTAPKATQ
jgi:hypothetical protein